jgi:hypothetical protein
MLSGQEKQLEGAETKRPTLTGKLAHDTLTADMDPVTDTATAIRKEKLEQDDQKNPDATLRQSMILSQYTWSHCSVHACVCFLPSLRAGIQVNASYIRIL